MRNPNPFKEVNSNEILDTCCHGARKESLCLSQSDDLRKVSLQLTKGAPCRNEELLWNHLLDPRQIRLFRKGLHMSQREAGELFGGGPNAFSRYECNRVKPPRTLGVLIYQYLCESSIIEAVYALRKLSKNSS